MIPTLRILQGDWIERLCELPEQSVHCCVTSPPYWGLRDYKVLGQLGLEKTPQEYVSKLVEGFREVWRVLRDDGTVWLNLGDSYASQGGSFDPKDWDNKQSTNRGSVEQVRQAPRGLKPKDLIGIPWRVAFALQEAGWYLRSEIIWAKANPMPESVTDRPTKAHEQIFLLSKRPRYYYDAEAIKEPVSGGAHARIPGNVNLPKGAIGYENGEERLRTRVGLLSYAERQYALHNNSRNDRADESQKYFPDSEHNGIRLKANGKNSRMVRERAAGRQDSKPNHSRSHVPGVGPKSQPTGLGIKNNESFAAAVVEMLPYRNKRDVWTVATWPYKEAHFATFPPKLIEPCILAGCPVGGTVLDPFLGSGTVALVAYQNGRSAIGIDLNPEYIQMARRRMLTTPGLALA